ALNVGDHEVNIEFLSEWAVSQEFHHPGTPKACLKQWGEPPAEFLGSRNTAGARNLLHGLAAVPPFQESPNFRKGRASGRGGCTRC
ncbi:MAG: hypothetical protein AB7I48_06395, partial [Planctomycetaceae bacterium]